MNALEPFWVFKWIVVIDPILSWSAIQMHLKQQLAI